MATIFRNILANFSDIFTKQALQIFSTETSINSIKSPSLNFGEIYRHCMENVAGKLYLAHPQNHVPYNETALKISSSMPGIFKLAVLLFFDVLFIFLASIYRNPFYDRQGHVTIPRKKLACEQASRRKRKRSWSRREK